MRQVKLHRLRNEFIEKNGRAPTSREWKWLKKGIFMLESEQPKEPAKFEFAFDNRIADSMPISPDITYGDAKEMSDEIAGFFRRIINWLKKLWNKK